MKIKFNCPFCACPTSACPIALNTIKRALRQQKVPSDTPLNCSESLSCGWYIVDPESNYCYWKWIKNPANQRPHSLEEIARLSGLSPAMIWHLQHRALNKFKKFWGRDASTVSLGREREDRTSFTGYENFHFSLSL